jgi:hypothetical protein
MDTIRCPRAPTRPRGSDVAKGRISGVGRTDGIAGVQAGACTRKDRPLRTFAASERIQRIDVSRLLDIATVGVELIVAADAKIIRWTSHLLHEGGTLRRGGRG